jgi:hypothetical protein
VAHRNNVVISASSPEPGRSNLGRATERLVFDDAVSLQSRVV